MNSLASQQRPCERYKAARHMRRRGQIKEIIDRCITTLIEEHDRKINNIYKISGLISVILTAIATIYTAFFK